MQIEIQFASCNYGKNQFRSRERSSFWGCSRDEAISIYYRANMYGRTPEKFVLIKFHSSLIHIPSVLIISIRNYSVYTKNGLHQKIYSVRSNQKLFSTRATKKATDIFVGDLEKQGTIVGAVALIIGTSIGSGILAIPKKTSPAGFVPSALAIILCWGFLLFEALLIAEINSSMLKKKRKKRKTEEQELEVISMRTMAQQTLGEWGGTFATINYVFLGYTTMVAYTSKSGEVLNHFSSIPSTICGFLFTMAFTLLISVGGTRTTDQVNQWMTAIMIGLLVAIELLAVSSGGWSGFEVSSNWEKVPSTLPVIIFTLVYHDLAPVICAYLGGDLARIRVSIIVGSIVPLVLLLIWNALALGLSAHADQAIDPVDLLMGELERGFNYGRSFLTSVLAVGTSLLGTLLAFSQFFLEQLKNFPWHSPSTQIQMLEGDNGHRIVEGDNSSFELKKWWGCNKFSIMATAIAVAPPLFISTTIPDVFSAATDIAGGYCMTMLYGVLPPAMALAMHAKSASNASGVINDNSDDDKGKRLFKVRPALIGVGLFACAVVMEQLLQDLSTLLF